MLKRMKTLLEAAMTAERFSSMHRQLSDLVIAKFAGLAQAVLQAASTEAAGILARERQIVAGRHAVTPDNAARARGLFCPMAVQAYEILVRAFQDSDGEMLTTLEAEVERLHALAPVLQAAAAEADINLTACPICFDSQCTRELVGCRCSPVHCRLCAACLQGVLRHANRPRCPNCRSRFTAFMSLDAGGQVTLVGQQHAAVQ
jgi:hypothetical protein